MYTFDGSRSHTRGPQSTSQGDNNTQVVEVGWADTTCRWRLQSWFWPGGVQHLPLFAPRDDDLLLLWSSCTAVLVETQSVEGSTFDIQTQPIVENIERP